MTRAQACTVITRLLDVVGKTPDPDPIVTPTPDVPSGPKDIVVTTNSVANNSTSYNIADNGFGTGRLANGKEINEANIAELLEKAKTIWPTGTTWTERTAANNNWYGNPSEIVRTMLSSTAAGSSTNTSPNYACGGFAAMISDYLFGKTGNPYHKVTNFSDIRPGDVIIMMQGTTARHVVIVTGINKTGSRAGCVFIAEGNLSKVINWPGTSGWDAASNEDLAAYGSYVALSRWPQ